MPIDTDRVEGPPAPEASGEAGFCPELVANTVQYQPCDTLPEALPPAAQPPTAETHTYGQILKSSALVGGSSAANIAIGIVGTKAMAILLGPAGYGLFGLYRSIANFTQSIAGMGVSSSGVRQIAEAVGSGDTGRIALTTAVLRRTSLVLGALGAALLLVFSRQVSIFTFQNGRHTAAVCLLSLAVFFQLVSWGQDALIQGMRRIADLAKMRVLGALFGMLLSIPLVYFFRENGVAPSLVGAALMYLAVSWWYSRRVRVRIPAVALVQVGQEAAALLKLGFAFMASSFMTMGIAYAVRIILLRKVGFAAAGYYQSAWTLGGLYVGFILQAMGADFYPRLTAHAHDNPTCNRLVNEQTWVGLLLAGPGLVATLTFAPVVIGLCYSAQFRAAVVVLRWICLGTALQVIIWPMGFIIVAKGRQTIFFCSQLAWTLVSVGLGWICVGAFGVNGAGIAFFGSYVFYVFVIYAVARHLSSFRLSAANKRTALLVLPLIASMFCVHLVLSEVWVVCLGTLATLLISGYSLRVLLTLVPWDQVPGPVRRLLLLFRFAANHCY